MIRPRKIRQDLPLLTAVKREQRENEEAHREFTSLL